VKLFAFTADSQETGIGVNIDETDYNLTKAFDIYQRAKGSREPISLQFLQILVEMGYCSGSAVQNIFAESWVQSKKAALEIREPFRFNLPITRPGKIIGLGRNYRAHAKEMNRPVPEEPIFFCKAPSSLLAHEEAIRIPSWMDGRVDHEAELALIIGKEGKNIPEEDALSHIAGYTILNDVTARAVQRKDIEEKKPWFRSKSLDTFCPTGPYVVPADLIPDPHNLEIRLTVNGEERQKSGTGNMIFSISHILAHLSRFMTLSPGDMIATGTPSGVSPIKAGDTVEVSITGLGTLRNSVIKEEPQ
jgi:2-keto-4-pentenoate hydratase/2-oxohepta-3-ene-1,7-dioic acid hydratase in catechol pathway